MQGRVIPGGWDFQLRYEGGYGERSFFRPRFEAPKGAHDWLTRGTFVATLELDRPAPGAAPAEGAAPTLSAIRIKVYQIH